MAVDAATIRELKDRLSFERHAQIRSLREIAAAAIAAAGQVRDVRLDQLERPEIADQDIVFDLLLELALESIASAATALIAARITARILRPLVGKLTENTGLIEAVPLIVMPYRRGFDVATVPRRLPDHKTSPELWRELWSGLASGLAGSAIDIGKDRIKNAVKQPPPGSPPNTFVQTAADSPASAVEEAVLRSCALHEHVIGRTFDSYEHDLDEQDLTDEKASDLKQFLTELAATPGVFGDDARRLRLFFETCIWCIGLPRIASMGSELVTRDPLGELAPSTTPIRKLTVSEDLASYLVRRLPHPAGNGLQTFAQHDPAMFERWSRAARPDLPWRDKDGNGLDSPYFVPNGAYTALAEHFGRMSTEMDQLVEKLNALTPKAIGEADDPMRRAVRRIGP